MDVAILHPAIAADASAEDQDTLVQVAAIAESLQRLGHAPRPIACTLDLAALRATLLARRPERVFNLVESVDGADALQYVPAALLDVLGIPYSGNPAEAIFQTTHKLLAKQLLSLAGLPTPAWLAPGQRSTAAGAEFAPPCILKAVWEHASRGMGDHSVLRTGDVQTVTQRLAECAQRTGRPWFAEQFIEGREFNLAMLDGPAGPRTLPPGEIDFSAFPPDKPRIVGHSAKWLEGSFEYENTPRTFDFSPQDQPLLDELQELALRCWHLFALRGYARVDFRVDAHGRPWILEINTNPCLAPEAGYAAALARAGITFDAAVEAILRV